MADNNVVDARGRSCPEPVILTKKALSKNGNKAQCWWTIKWLLTISLVSPKIKV